MFISLKHIPISSKIREIDHFVVVFFPELYIISFFVEYSKQPKRLLGLSRPLQQCTLIQQNNQASV